MIVLLHVVIALFSVGIASYSYARPNGARLRLSYTFIGLTFFSGLYLVWTTPGTMLHTCLSGIAYLTLVTAMTVLTRRKLATIAVDAL